MRVPDLQTPIVEGETVLGEVCHIAGASAHGPRQIGQCRLWDFSPRQIDWIENRRATQGIGLFPA
jgi:hypothetical protein